MLKSKRILSFLISSYKIRQTRGLHILVLKIKRKNYDENKNFKAFVCLIILS